MFRGVHKFCKFTVFQTGTVNLSSIEFNWALYATTDKNMQFHLRLLISLSRHSPRHSGRQIIWGDFCGGRWKKPFLFYLFAQKIIFSLSWFKTNFTWNWKQKDGPRSLLGSSLRELNCREKYIQWCQEGIQLNIGV